MPIAVLAALAAGSGFGSGIAGAAVIYNEPTSYFDIGASGVRGEDIWNAIRRWGPTSSLSSRRVTAGTTTGSYSYRFDQVKSRDGCSIKNFKITVTAKILLPSWDKSFRAPAESQRYWQCLETIVDVHEKRHGQIFRETAESIDQAIAALPSGLDCDALPATVKRIATEKWNDGDGRQDDFDRDEHAANRFEGCNKNLISTDSRSAKQADTQADDVEIQTRSRAAKSNRSAVNAAARISDDGSDALLTIEPAKTAGTPSATRSKFAIFASLAFIALLLAAAVTFYRWLSSQYRETDYDEAHIRGRPANGP